MPRFDPLIRRSLVKYWTHRKLLKTDKARLERFFGELAEEEIEAECNKCDYYLLEK